MTDTADASAVIDLDGAELTAGLDQIAARFGEIASQINTSFAAANGQLTQTAASAHSIGAAAPAVATFHGWLINAANAARLVFTTISQISAAFRVLMPLVRFLPDSVGAWVPRLKQAIAAHEKQLAQVTLLQASVRAATGSLGLLSAGLAAMQISSAGVFQSMAFRVASLVRLKTGLRLSVRNVELGLVAMGTAGGLAMSRIVSTARGALGLVRSVGAATLAAGRGMMMASAGMFGGLRGGASTAAMILAPMAGLALTLGPVGAAALGVAGAFGAVKKSINAASETQSLQTSFVTLLGSVKAARERMGELTQFATTTPFEIPGIAKASRTLEVLTKGALSTGPGLRMVGDAAAMTQQPIEELSVHFGRLYDGLQNGRPVGEAMARLQELGILSSVARGRLEALQAAGEKGDAVWQVAAKEFGKFGGEMERQSRTWGGMMSNLSDSIGALFRAFGAPVITSLTPFMQQLLQWLSTLVVWAEKGGQIFAGWSALLLQIFSNGNFGEAIEKAGALGFLKLANVALRNFAGLGSFLIEVLGGAGKVFLGLMGAATTADFWKGLGNALLSAGAAFGALLMEFTARMLDSLSDLPGIGDRLAKAANVARDMGGEYAQQSIDLGAKAGANLEGIVADAVANFGDTLPKAFAAFAETRANTGDVLDTSAASKAFLEWLAPLAQKADKTVRDSARLAEQGGLPPPIGATQEELAAGKNGKQNEAAGLQRIGGGGGFSIMRADPLLAENRNQTGELRGMRTDLQKLTQALTQKRPETPAPGFY